MENVLQKSKNFIITNTYFYYNFITNTYFRI